MLFFCACYNEYVALGKSHKFFSSFDIFSCSNVCDLMWGSAYSILPPW